MYYILSVKESHIRNQVGAVKESLWFAPNRRGGRQAAHGVESQLVRIVRIAIAERIRSVQLLNGAF
jgi:hypothetical protein